MFSVEVVIATRNYGKWICDALNSVLAQDYQGPISITVIDDASTDDTRDQVLGMTDDYSFYGADPWMVKGHIANLRFTYVHNSSQQGPARARNMAMRNSKADIFAILDADDVWLPSRLSKCVPLFEVPEIALVYTDYENFSDGNALVIREFKEPYSLERLRQSCIVTNACLLRRTAMEAIGYYDEELRVAEDWDVFLRLGEKYMLWHHPECLCRIRVGSHNHTTSVPPSVWQENWAKVSQKLHKRMAGAH